MATKYVEYCMHGKLPCSYASDRSVILCVQDEALVAPTDCPEEVGTYVGPFINAEVCQAFTLQDPCQLQTWQYTFSYDDAQLADPETPLSSADITGVFCESCLTDWADYRAGSEVFVVDNGDGTNTLTSQHGCEYTFVGGGSELLLAVTDTNSIDLTINGTLPQTLSADSKISADAGNTISIHADGLYTAGGSDWHLLGNAGTVAGTNFCGTTDNVRYDIRVNNVIARRTYPDATCPIIADGHPDNLITGSGCAVLSGGDDGVNGPHDLTGYFSIICGGAGNLMIPDATQPGGGYSAIVGGIANIVEVDQVLWSGSGDPQGGHFIGGGFDNLLINAGDYSVIGGGLVNQISYDTTNGKVVTEYVSTDFIGGGDTNQILGYHDDIVGSTPDRLGNNVVGGGNANDIKNSLCSTICGGNYEVIDLIVPLTFYYSYPVLNDINGPWNCDFIGGGYYLAVNGCQRSASVSGYLNLVYSEDCSAILSGALNQIISTTQAPVINASINPIDPPDATGVGNVIIGGEANHILDGRCSTVLGGAWLQIGANTVGYQSPSTRTFTTIDSGTRSFFNFNTGAGNYWEVAQVDISAFSDVAYFGDVDVWVANTGGTATKLKFIEPNSDLDFSSANYTSMRAQAQSANVDYILPAAGGAVGNTLQLSAVSGTDNTMAWTSDASLLGKLTGANFNSTADQAITINAARYYITAILVTNPSISLTTAVGGIYAAPAKATPLIEAITDYTSLVVAADAQYMDWALYQSFINGNLTNKTRTEATIYLSLTTGQGAAATADIYVYGKRIA